MKTYSKSDWWQPCPSSVTQPQPSSSYNISCISWESGCIMKWRGRALLVPGLIDVYLPDSGSRKRSMVTWILSFHKWNPRYIQRACHQKISGYRTTLAHGLFILLQYDLCWSCHHVSMGRLRYIRNNTTCLSPNLIFSEAASLQKLNTLPNPIPF